MGRLAAPRSSPCRASADLVAYGRDVADLEHPETLGPLIERERLDVIDQRRGLHRRRPGRGTSGHAPGRSMPAPLARSARWRRRTMLLSWHYSTDYVFDGQASGAYSEDAHTSPLSVYGASKLAGEVLLRDSGARHIILRTSWVYAPVGKNFPLTILRLAKERETLTVVADQHGAPTPASLIAEVTAQVIMKPVAGVHHLVPTGETSWHGFAQLLIAEAAAAGAKLKLTPEGVRAIPAAEYLDQGVIRPCNSRLDTTKFRTTFGAGFAAQGARRRRPADNRALAAEGRL